MNNRLERNGIMTVYNINNNLLRRLIMCALVPPSMFLLLFLFGLSSFYENISRALRHTFYEVKDDLVSYCVLVKECWDKERSNE